MTSARSSSPSSACRESARAGSCTSSGSRSTTTSDLIVWRRGRSLPYGEGIAYWALGEIVKAQAGILESDDAPETEAKLGAAVGALLSDRGEAAWVERHLRPLTGLPVDETTPSREEAFAARRRFLEALAEDGPAILVFEDIHWADDDLLDFVDELADRLDSVPLLIVCTARPELLSRRPGWGGGKSNATTASLEQLSDADTARLLGALLDRSVLPAEMQEALLRHAGGVPLFAEEYARLIAAGEPTSDVPETLQGIVAARIDGLGAAEKSLLQDASVLGKVFWTDALAALSSSTAWELDERLRSLERREFVRRERRSAVEGARQYIFLHALVRDTAYGQIPRAARAEKHRRTAEWIAGLSHGRAEDRAEMLVHHLEAAIEYGEAAGLDVADLRPLLATALSDAADRAWALSMPPRAAQLYRRALDAAPAGRADGARSSSASGPRSGAQRASAAAESATWRRRSKRCSRPATARRPPPGWWCWVVSAGMPARESASSASGRSLSSRASGRRKHGVRCSSTWRLARRSRGAAKRRSSSARKRSPSPAIWAIAISRSRR